MEITKILLLIAGVLLLASLVCDYLARKEKRRK